MTIEKNLRHRALAHSFTRVKRNRRGSDEEYRPPERHCQRVRRSPQMPLVLERGLLVELVLYMKPNRDLHTIGQISVAKYYPSIRFDLGKLALRDAAFELILKSVPAPRPIPNCSILPANFSIASKQPMHLPFRFMSCGDFSTGGRCTSGSCSTCRSAFAVEAMPFAGKGGSLQSNEEGSSAGHAAAIFRHPRFCRGRWSHSSLRRALRGRGAITALIRFLRRHRSG